MGHERGRRQHATAGLGIATDPRGNSYVTGSFIGTATFGAGEANETVLSSRLATADIFVAKYARDGTLLWATSAGGPSRADGGRGIATDPRGNSYVTGDFRGHGDVRSGRSQRDRAQQRGRRDLFVAKYRSQRKKRPAHPHEGNRFGV